MVEEIELRNGIRMPSLGFGTYRLGAGREAKEAVACALRTGYRHIDTAAMYENESDVGKAVRESGIPREDIFITTKLRNNDHGYDKALKAFDRSNRLLGLGYIDLYLIHWPVTGSRGWSWKALERILKEGKCRAIGVSNYTVRHMNELESQAEVRPMAHQIELSPFLQQRELVEWCRERGIAIQAYCPLTRGKRFEDPVVSSVAEGLGRTPSQVLLRWSIQKGFAPLPKSSRPERIMENARVFDFSLSEKEMDLLDGLDLGSRLSWDSSGVP